jgi:hypothetical protein
VGGRLWLTGFPVRFCEKYGKLARTDLKNERISRSGGFQACSEIIRCGWVGGLSPALNLSMYSTFETHPLGKSQNPAAPQPAVRQPVPAVQPAAGHAYDAAACLRLG